MTMIFLKGDNVGGQLDMMMKMSPHLRWTLTSALYMLLKNQFSKTLSRLFPRQKRFHLEMTFVVFFRGGSLLRKIKDSNAYCLICSPSYSRRCPSTWGVRKHIQMMYTYLILDINYSLKSPKGAYLLFIEYSNIPYLLNTAKDDYSLYIFDLVGAQAWSPPTPAQRPWSLRAS